MIFIGFAVSWLGYTLVTTGYCWVKGYDLSFSQIASPTHYYQGTWPPPLAPDDIIIPNGKAAGAVTTAKKTAASTATPFNTSGKAAAKLGKEIGPGSIQTLP